MNKVLEINQLRKDFGKMTAVQNLSLTVEKGNIYGLLGPNGSGKSTTLGIILNVVNPTSGEWSWFNEGSSTQLLKRIGAIIERPNFYPYLSAEKNLEIVAKIKEVPFHKIEEKLELVGLLDRKMDAFKTYSLGMKQRLAIAGALLNDPEVLILDEPTNGLDPQGIIQIRELILKIAAQGTTIILASHLLDEVEKVCSHVVILEKGKTLYCGSVNDMQASNGFVELASDDLALLLETATSMEFFTHCKEENGVLKAYLKEEIDTTTINKAFFDQKIILSHLAKRKDTLEQQFLQMTFNDRA